MPLDIQLNNGLGCALLEFADSVLADEVTTKNQRFSIDGNTIPIYVDDHLTEVYVHDLPIGLENTEIVNALTCFGEVLMISNDRWKNFFPGLLNGIRVAKMKLKQPVPKQIMVAKLTATIIYKGQNASWRLSKQKKSKRSSISINNAKTNSSKDQPIVATNSSNKNNNNNDTKTSRNHIQSTSRDQEDKINCNNNNTDNNNKTKKHHKQGNNNNNTNNNKNKINQSEKAGNSSNENNDGFQVVLSKAELKNRKRTSVEHTQEDLPEPKRLEVAEDILESV